MSAADTALAGLFQAHASELHGFARRRVGRQEAEDVVQDAYLHLLQRGTAATLDQPRAYLSHRRQSGGGFRTQGQDPFALRRRWL